MLASPATRIVRQIHGDNPLSTIRPMLTSAVRSRSRRRIPRQIRRTNHTLSSYANLPVQATPPTFKSPRQVYITLIIRYVSITTIRRSRPYRRSVAPYHPWDLVSSRTSRTRVPCPRWSSITRVSSRFRVPSVRPVSPSVPGTSISSRSRVPIVPVSPSVQYCRVSCRSCRSLSLVSLSGRTRISSRSSRTRRTHITRRTRITRISRVPVGPIIPVGPILPVGPRIPFSPICPVYPVGPVLPVTPVARYHPSVQYFLSPSVQCFPSVQYFPSDLSNRGLSLNLKSTLYLYYITIKKIRSFNNNIVYYIIIIRP
jgi:hypothetical protein